MISRPRALTVVALLASLTAGCTQWAQKEWPPYAATAQSGQGAILFKITADTQVNDASINSLLLMWPDRNEPHPEVWHHNQHYRVLGERINKSPDDVVLIPLKPGVYSRTIVRFFYVGYEVHYADLEPSRPFEFAVAPGQVTVLGGIHLTAAVSRVAETATTGQITASANVRIEDDASAKSAILAEALARPEAESSQWRSALEAARRELAPAR